MQEEFILTIQSPLLNFVFLLEEKVKRMQEEEQLEVEEIDAKVVVCPHSKKTYAIDAMGVIVFSHKDEDTYCNLMNNFSTPSEVIIEWMCQTRALENTATMRTLLSTSLVARKRLYEQLSLAKDDKLADLLELTMNMFNQTRKRDQLVQELVTTFSWPVIRNLKLLFQIDESSKHSSQPRYLPMQQLTANHIKGIQTIIRQATEKRKQTIDDILFS